MSPGERVLLRIRWFVYDATARPVAVAAVLIVVAVLAASAAALLGASTGVLAGGFRNWVLLAENGFTTDVELGLLIAVVLLVIDSRTGEPFPGQEVLLGGIAIVAAAGVVANVGAIVAWRTQLGVSAGPLGTTAEAWTELITASLAPSVLAAIACWLAVTEALSCSRRARIPE